MNMILRNRSSLAPRRVDLFSEVHKEFDRVFNEVFGAPFFHGVNKHKGYPLVDAVREKDNLTLQYTVPGVVKEDLNVEITEDEIGQLVIVSGKLSDTYVFDESQYQIREMSSQEFRRIVRLPEDIDSSKEPSVYLNDGILTIVFDLKENINDQKPKTKKLSIS